MSLSPRVIRAALLVAAAVVLAVVAAQLRDKRKTAELTVENIHAQLPVHHLDTTALDMDPDHSSSAIDQQIAGGSMGGFVASAAATLAEPGAGDGDPACVMGYYDAADVPVFDHLAEEFAVCDRWFSSVPGATLPNRLYGLAGRPGAASPRAGPALAMPAGRPAAR